MSLGLSWYFVWIEGVYPSLMTRESEILTDGLDALIFFCTGSIERVVEQ